MDPGTEFKWSETFEVTNDVISTYEENGYMVLRGLINSNEMDHLKKALELEDGILKHTYELPDGHGRNSRLALWKHPGSDVTGMVARAEKLARTAEKLLGGEVYHYHGKLLMKEAMTGGCFVWHQDYGYWYKNGVLFPDGLITYFIAIDKIDKENGCLQILTQSHKAGRVDHNFTGGQQGADLTRVEHLKKECPLAYVELNPGDALVFHPNLLHSSAQNNSSRRRWAYAVCYNMKANDQMYECHVPKYTPLKIVPNSEILSCINYTDMTGKEFITPADDHTVKGNEGK